MQHARYVEGRLTTLYERVNERVEALREEDNELYERRQAASSRLRALRTQIESSGEWVVEDENAVASRAPRTQFRSLHALCEQLRTRRMGVWDALDEAESRLDEILAAKRTLARRGVSGLDDLIQRRSVSQSLRTYLEKLL